MSINKYIGSRYVPLYVGIHDETIEYEPLSIVSNVEKTETYTSKQHVPVGISLNNETYWAQSGWSNADLQIEVENAPVVSTDDSELAVERTKNGYLLTLSDSNSFDCGGDFGEAYTLNTMYDVGRYMIKPSICSGVPSEISDNENPAELVIADYTEIGDNIMKQYQKITAFDDDNAASFIRFHDGNNWGDWKMIGGGIGSLPIASTSVLGGVKIGDGISVTNDGTISANGWKDITSEVGTATKGELYKCYVNETSKLCFVYFRLAGFDATKTGAVSQTERGFECDGFPAMPKSSDGNGRYTENRIHISPNAECFAYEVVASNLSSQNKTTVFVPTNTYFFVSGSGATGNNVQFVYPIA